MQDIASHAVAYPHATPSPADEPLAREAEADVVVSTHVLVPEDQVERLRLLAKRTRVAQSEYLREAVDDLLRKYGASGT